METWAVKLMETWAVKLTH